MFYHRVCLLQLHVYGTRHGRCADRKNREIMEYIVWLDSGAVMEWERLTAAAQDANRQCAQWFRKASETHFLPWFPPAETEKTALPPEGKSNHGLNDKPDNPWYPKRVIRKHGFPKHKLLDN